MDILLIHVGTRKKAIRIKEMMKRCTNLLMMTIIYKWFC